MESLLTSVPYPKENLNRSSQLCACLDWIILNEIKSMGETVAERELDGQLLSVCALMLMVPFQRKSGCLKELH